MIINGILQQLSFTMLEYVLDNSRHKRENVSLATGCFVSGLRKEDNSVTLILLLTNAMNLTELCWRKYTTNGEAAEDENSEL